MGRTGFGDIRKALESGAYLYDRENRMLWGMGIEHDGTGARIETVLRAATMDESDVPGRIVSGIPLPVAKDGKAERLTGDWGVYGEGRQPYHGMTADERFVRLCQMAAGRPDRWSLFGADGQESPIP